MKFQSVLVFVVVNLPLLVRKFQSRILDKYVKNIVDLSLKPHLKIGKAL